MRSISFDEFETVSIEPNYPAATRALERTDPAQGARIVRQAGGTYLLQIRQEQQFVLPPPRLAPWRG